MKNIKVERAVYAAWDYELELKHLNEMSEQGWQLIQGGCFYTKYERREGVVYRYQLDHNMKIENRMRYIDTFREQGWEYINSTFNGWHYFRKPYDPAKPAEEYEIYSDRPSREEMAGRLSKLLTVLAIVVGLLFVGSLASFVLEPGMAMIGIVVEMLAALILTGSGAKKMRKAGCGETPARKFPVAALVAVALVGLVWFTVFASQEFVVSSANDSGAAEVGFEMKLPDWVGISVECESAVWMEMSIENAEGEIVFSDSAAAGEVATEMTQKRNVFLMPGEYIAAVQCGQETFVSLQID